MGTIRNDIEQLPLDFANGKVDFGEAVVEMATIQTRIALVQDSAPDGDLKTAIDRWALSRQRIMDNFGNESEMDRLKPENNAASDALDERCS